MIYGLSGASGVGKSTIGQLISESLDITFQKTSITESARRHGFNAVADLSMSDRIRLQELLLQDHIKMLETVPRPCILDRTPIDMIGYMLGEVRMNSHLEMSPDEMRRVSEFVNNCLLATRKYYDVIFHLGILPFYQQADTRPIENIAYQRHSDYIMRGALSEMQGVISSVALNTTDLNSRHDFIHDTIVQRLDAHEAQRKSTATIH